MWPHLPSWLTSPTSLLMYPAPFLSGPTHWPRLMANPLTQPPAHGDQHGPHSPRAQPRDTRSRSLPRVSDPLAVAIFQVMAIIGSPMCGRNDQRGPCGGSAHWRSSSPWLPYPTGNWGVLVLEHGLGHTWRTSWPAMTPLAVALGCTVPDRNQGSGSFSDQRIPLSPSMSALSLLIGSHVALGALSQFLSW